MTLKLKEKLRRKHNESAKAISEKLLENRRKSRISFSLYGIQDILSHHDTSLSLSIKLIRFRWNILGPVYKKRSDPWWEGFPSPRVTLGETTLNTFLYKLQRPVYMRSCKVVSGEKGDLGGSVTRFTRGRDNFLQCKHFVPLTGLGGITWDTMSMRQLCHFQNGSECQTMQSKSSAKSQGKRWAFTSAMIECLINCLKQYKCLCEFNSVDFNPDKVQLYEKVRQGKSNYPIPSRSNQRGATS